jgi:tetratricopeptide (TPR) repeat protein
VENSLCYLQQILGQKSCGYTMNLHVLNYGGKIMRLYTLSVLIYLFLLAGCTKKPIDYLAEGRKILKTNTTDKNELNKAAEYFKAELKRNPNSLETLANLSNTYDRMNERDSSILIISEKIQTHNDALENLYIFRGMEYFVMSDYDNSIRDFKSALNFNQKNKRVYKMIVTSTIFQKFNHNGTWLGFGKKDVTDIINEVYPKNFVNKPSADEFITGDKINSITE